MSVVGKDCGNNCDGLLQVPVRPDKLIMLGLNDTYPVRTSEGGLPSPATADTDTCLLLTWAWRVGPACLFCSMDSDMVAV